jgi:protein TonB
MESLRSAIEQMKSYPAMARARKQEGKVEVAFTLRKDGMITDISVTRSSSFTALDDAGANTLSKLARFQPIPDAVSETDLKLVLPIEFRLEN